MAIPDEDVAKVRAATDIVAVIGEYTPLKRVGRRFVGLCPLHAEKSGSFSVNAEEGLYYCFGCQASGDAITFLRSVEACTFVEAVERLAAKAGVTLHYEAGGRERADRESKARLLETMASAVAYYHDQLVTHPDGRHARRYLRTRGYDGALARQFSLGWAPGSGTALIHAVAAPSERLVGAGLAVRGSHGLVDSFRSRVIFPIYDPSGKPVALGGRVLPEAGEEGGPKYRNSPETPIYQKRSTLYGLNWARQAIVKSGEVIVCEGYTDVIGLASAGLTTAVATCGTALTEDHFRILSRFAKKVVLAFDADAAGQSAAARIYEWERRHELEVAVAALPDGCDPADLARDSPEALRDAIGGARTFLAFRVERAIERAELRSAEGRAKAAQSAIEMIAEHPNDLVRDQYLVNVADRTRIELGVLRPRLEELVRAARTGGHGGSARRGGTGGHGGSAGRGGSRRDGASPSAEDRADPETGRGGRRLEAAGETGRDDTLQLGSGPPPWVPDEARGQPARAQTRHQGRAQPGERAARDALVLAIQARDSIIDRLDSALFADPLQLATYRALAGAANLREALENADIEVGDYLRQLAVSDSDADADQTLAALARAAATVALRELEADARQAEAEGDEQRLGAAGAAISWLKLQLELTQESSVGERATSTANPATQALVGWLSQRHREAT